MKRARTIVEDLRLAVGYLLMGWVIDVLPDPEKKLLVVHLGRFFLDTEPVEMARQWAAWRDVRNG